MNAGKPTANAPPTRETKNEALAAALAAQVEGEVRFDAISQALYSTDASVYQIVPVGVVIPRTEQDVIETVKLCDRFRIPVTARGGGTSQAGQAIGLGVLFHASRLVPSRPFM